MASKIRILTEETINQIAAGEVIENPASVVKELVENAIDAGASHVTIESLGGGFQWIKISDDGTGMTPDDAVLSLERHATSKIVSAEDLFELSTMGFRGEALASIAAISKMQLTTAMENAPAIVIEIEGGKIIHVGPAARARGTTIEVRSLFYNVPARKKFQKSAAASSAEITKIITQLALAHPEIGIELIQQNRSQFHLTAASGEGFLDLLKKRVDVLLNDGFLSSSHPVEFKQEQYQGRGLIAEPLFSRHNRSGQYLFINRRPVFCLPISYAIRDAYGTRLNADRHPVYVLHLSISPSLVDVNVHPQKKEVRLREESQLKYVLHQAVNDALAKRVETMTSPMVVAPDFAILQTSSFRSHADQAGSLIFKEEESGSISKEISYIQEMNILGFYGRYLLVEAKSLPSQLLPKNHQIPTGIVWVDLSAVEARVQFDNLIQHSQKIPLSQGLLIPMTVSLSRADAQLLEENLEIAQKLGLQLRVAGQSAFLIEAIPPFLEEGEIGKILEELIAELHGLERENTKELEKLRRLAACISKRVKSRKRPYGLTEARIFVQRLTESSDPFHCPYGRSTLFYISEEEIENYFAPKKR